MDSVSAFFDEIMSHNDNFVGSDFNDTIKTSGGADIVRSGIPALVYVGWGEGGHDLIDGRLLDVEVLGQDQGGLAERKSAS